VLNDLEVKTADIKNAYLTALVLEKIWYVLGPEFGADAGKCAIVVWSLYGLKSACASLWNHLADCMWHLGWELCITDQNLWMKAEIRPDDGHKYYAYALLYVDNICVVHHNAELCVQQVGKYFKMKPGSIGDPDFYLGVKLRTKRLLNGVLAWSMSCSKYIQVAVRNVNVYVNMTHCGQGLPKHASGPFLSGYVPELDMSAKLNDKDASFYQSQISVLHWCVELGQINIIMEVLSLSSHVALQ
jgi:hypothetical protein